MGRLIQDIHFTEKSNNPFISAVSQTKHIGKLCLIDIDKKTQLTNGYSLNAHQGVVLKFFEYRHLSYSQLHQLELDVYRNARRISILSWLLDDYLDNNGFANPISVFLNDRYLEKNYTPFWISCPGSTREVIDYWFGAKPTMRGLGFVPHSYKCNDIAIVREFNEGQEFLDYATSISPNPNHMDMRWQGYTTKLFGESIMPNFTNHIDSDDAIKREQYYDLSREYFSNNNVHFTWGRDITFDNIEYFKQNRHNPDVSIHFKGQFTGPQVIKTCLILPLMQKHPELIDFLVQDHTIGITKI